jgi:hypothetical protein
VATIYSSRLALFKQGSSPTLLYTVPAGVVVVVRSMSAFISGTAGTNVLAISIGPGGVVAIIQVCDGTTYQRYDWNGRLVLNSMETLTYTGNTTGCELAISGYVLQAP